MQGLQGCDEWYCEDLGEGGSQQCDAPAPGRWRVDLSVARRSLDQLLRLAEADASRAREEQEQEQYQAKGKGKGR